SSQGIKTHAKAREKWGKDRDRPLTAAAGTATITYDESQQHQEFMNTPSSGPWTEHRPLRLTPDSCRGRGSSPARFASKALSCSSPSAWESVHWNGASRFPRRIGGDASTVQEKKRKYRHQQRYHRHGGGDPRGQGSPWHCGTQGGACPPSGSLRRDPRKARRRAGPLDGGREVAGPLRPGRLRPRIATPS